MVLRISALLASLVLFVTGVVLRDIEAIVIAVLLVGASLLVRGRTQLVGRVVLALLFLDVLAWMAPAAWSNAVHGGAASTLAVPLVLVAASVAGLAAVIRLPDRPVALGAGALFLVALVVAALPMTSDDQNLPDLDDPGVVAISSRGAKFSPSKLTVVGDQVAVVFHNKDLFWHTFTIDELGVDIYAPVGGKRVERVTAKPGSYYFYCAIPGHKSAGMEGTLVVT